MHLLDLWSTSAAVMRLYEFATPVCVHRLADASPGMGAFVKDARLLRQFETPPLSPLLERDTNDHSKVSEASKREAVEYVRNSMAFMSLTGVRARYERHHAHTVVKDGRLLRRQSVHYLFRAALCRLEEDLPWVKNLYWCICVREFMWLCYPHLCKRCMCLEAQAEVVLRKRARLEERLQKAEMEKRRLEAQMDTLNTFLHVNVPFEM